MNTVIKQSVKKALQTLGLLKFAFRIYEATKVAELRNLCRSIRYRKKGAPDGLPIPPLKLIVLVAGTSDISWFLEGGKLAAQSINDTLDKNGLYINDFQEILDFGCGCGRVLRWWKYLERASIYGTDCNHKLIDWCRLNLTFAQFETNDLDPPLSYTDEKFDLIYALSIFTHLPELLQLSWINELWRILRPGRYLLVTTHGGHYIGRLTKTEQNLFQAGRLIVRGERTPGTNLCTAYHPVKYVQEKLVKRFEIIDFIPSGAKGNSYQDVFLLRKPMNSSNVT